MHFFSVFHIYLLSFHSDFSHELSQVGEAIPAYSVFLSYAKYNPATW